MFLKGFVFYLFFLAVCLCGTAFACGEAVVDSRLPIAKKPQTCSIEKVPNDLLELLSLHNQSRAKGGRCGAARKPPASSLQWSCELALASKIHAKDMETNDFLSHLGSDNSTIGLRATRAGYRWREVSENVAQGYQSSISAFDGWVNSQAHCINIMSDAYQEFGAARVGEYWVVMLGRRKDF